jgi:hypothetical protein
MPGTVIFGESLAAGAGGRGGRRSASTAGAVLVQLGLHLVGDVELGSK